MNPVPDAHSDSPTQVLQEAAPLSRASLYSEAVCKALWAEADANPRTGAASVVECAEVFRGFEHSPAHMYEVRTALDYHGVIDAPHTSTGFRNEIARHDRN